MIPLGYELGTGKRVNIPLNHMCTLGQTQLSGKTTTMEAVAIRSGVRAIAFITKPGEKSFRLQNPIPAFFTEATSEEYWKHVVAILEYRGETHLGWRERGVVIKLCQDYEKHSSRIAVDGKGKSKRERVKYGWKTPKTLRELLDNIEAYLPYARSSEEMICIQLREYLRPAIKEIERTEFSEKLELQRGINVMDITELSDGLKSLVIRSVIEWVHRHGRKVVVIVPEAWKFIPEGRSTPVKLALEGLIREGAGLGNFVWMDSQDLRGVDKKLLRSVIVWLFGVQRQRNEVASTLDSIPDHPKPSATEIMQLGRGEFYVCYGNTLVRTYVQPAGMEDTHAEAIARGEERPESWVAIARSLDAEEKADEPQEHRDDFVLQEEGTATPASAGDGLESGVVASDAGGSEVNEDEGEDEMWKETHEKFIASLATALGCDNDALSVTLRMRQLREAHDALAARVEALIGSGHLSADVAPPTASAAASAKATPSSSQRGPGAVNAAADSNGDYDAIYRYIVTRAAKEPEPAILSLIAERPELMINVSRKRLELDGVTLKGFLASLIAEKFFDTAKNGNQAFQEVQRRGRRTAKPNVYRELDGLAELGFLTKEDTGYRAVSGMKVHIVEARA